jgi:hypothetical protein
VREADGPFSSGSTLRLESACSVRLNKMLSRQRQREAMETRLWIRKTRSADFSKKTIKTRAD